MGIERIIISDEYRKLYELFLENTRLIDRKELIRRHPALGEKKFRLEWLVRTRQIPCVRIGRIIYFDEAEVAAFIRSKKIPVQNGEGE